MIMYLENPRRVNWYTWRIFKRIYLSTKAAFLRNQQQNKSEDVMTKISFMLFTNRKENKNMWNLDKGYNKI